MCECFHLNAVLLSVRVLQTFYSSSYSFFSRFKNIYCLISRIGNCIHIIVYILNVHIYYLPVVRCSLLVDVFIAIGPEFICCTDLLYRAKFTWVMIIQRNCHKAMYFATQTKIRKLKLLFCILVPIGNSPSDSFKTI